MDPLEQIKQIIVENEEESKFDKFKKRKKADEGDEGDEGDESEKGEEKSPKMNGAKAMQMRNTESSRSQENPGQMPSQGGEVVLKGPGVEVLQSLINKIRPAVHPQNDPKAKSSSKAMNFSDITNTNLGDNEGSSESSESEESYEENKSAAMKEHLDALFNGESLSEDFKNKAALIFETALAEREQQLAEELEAHYESLAEEYVEYVQNELNEQIDSYLGYVINEWVEENRLQIESGVRLEIAESFIEGLRTLFVEHGVDVPDSDVNLVDELGNRISDLEGRLNEEINRNIELNEQLEGHRRNEVIATLGEDLTATEFEKFATLCENVAYDEDENYINKINTIKESYFGENAAPSTNAPVNFLTESTIEDEQIPTETLNENMDQYIQTLSRLSKK